MARRSARDRELDQIHEELARERRRFNAQVRKRVDAMLTNEAGFARLRAITDEEWAAAELEGEPVEDAA